jgi:hypothetical protein
VRPDLIPPADRPSKGGAQSWLSMREHSFIQARSLGVAKRLGLQAGCARGVLENTFSSKDLRWSDTLMKCTERNGIPTEGARPVPYLQHPKVEV